MTNHHVNLDALEQTVNEARRMPLTWSHKACAASWYGHSVAEVIARKPRLSTLSTPLLTLDDSALTANIENLATWARDHDVSLAPHGKTTMAPALWRRQLMTGAWAITVANEPQLRVARGAGVPRIMVANMMIRPGALRWIAGELARDDGFELYCWVDSVDAVALMDEALAGAGAIRPLSVLVELGSGGARTGARNIEVALEVARHVTRSRYLRLAGTAGYEGVVSHTTTPDGLAAVDDYLQRLRHLHERLLDDVESDEAILTAGGSTYFDRVATILAGVTHGGPAPTRVVVRAGGYAIHDDGFYRRTTPSTRNAGPRLQAAMHGWARVLSLPEPGLAHLDAGRRDLPFDLDWPTPQIFIRSDSTGATTTWPLEGHRVVDMNDQHTHLRYEGTSPLSVGDVVRLGLSHPCTALDKWSLIPVIDDADGSDPAVVDLIRTYF